MSTGVHRDGAIDAWRRNIECLREELRGLAKRNLEASRNSFWPLIEFSIFARLDDGESAVKEFSLHRGNVIRQLKATCSHPKTTNWERLSRCVFSTNLPQLSAISPAQNERDAHLLEARRAMLALFRRGEKLLESIPFVIPQTWSPLSASGEPLELERQDTELVDASQGVRWLMTIFESSWGPAKAFGLNNPRLTFSKKFREAIGNVARHRTEWTLEHQAQGLVPDCFFSLSRDVLTDSVFLIDWLISLGQQSVDLAGKSDGNDAGKVSQTARCRPCDWAALQQYEEAERLAEERRGMIKTDRQAYDYYKEHCEGDGSNLPSFETWTKYLRRARKSLGKQKNKPGVGYETGSVVKASRLDRRGPNRTNPDR